MATIGSQAGSPREHGSGTLSAVARIYWMLLGYGILGMLGATIAISPPSFSSRDAAYWSVAVSIIAIRYCDVAYLHGTTADGEPATTTHWKRYAGAVAAAAVAVWTTAHGAAYLLT